MSLKETVDELFEPQYFQDVRGRPFILHFMLLETQHINLGSQIKWKPRICL